MNREQAIDFASRFRGLMPRMTDEQTIAVRDMLIQIHDHDSTAWEKLRGYAEQNREFELSEVKTMLHGPRTGNVARTAQFIEWDCRERAQAEADAERVGQLIAALSNDELANLKAIVLEKQTDFIRKEMAYKDPRSHNWLRTLIVDHIDKHGMVAA